MKQLLLILVILAGSLVLGCSEDSSDDYLNNGYAHIEEGQYEEAINDFTKAFELAPDDAKALVGRAIANAWAGNYQQAEDDFNTAIDISSGRYTLITDEAYVAWGIALTAQYSSYSKLDEAEYLFDSAISRDPNNPDAYTGRALMHLKGAYGDVIEYESIGYYHLRRAISDFEKGIELDPEGIQGRIRRFNFEGDMAFLLNYTKAYNRNGALLVSAYHNYSDALEAYDKVLEVSPENVEALIGRGSAYVGLQQYDLALHDFNKASELAPDNPHAYAGSTSADQLPFIQGNIYLEQEQWHEAITEFSKAIELNPEFAEAYANRAVARLEQLELNLAGGNEYNFVIADCEKAIELNPLLKLNSALARAYVRRGDYYFEHALSEADYNKAIVDYTMAMKIDPLIKSRRPVDVYIEQAEDYLYYANYEKAIVYFSKAIELDSGNTRYYYTRLAEAYHGRGMNHYKYSTDRDKAIADYTRAIELDPTNAEYYLSRGFVYDEWADYYYDAGRASEQMDSNNKAIADYTKVIELEPEVANYYYFRGRCYADNSDYVRAIADYTRAIELGELGDLIAYVYWGRAIAHENLGNKNQALADYRMALTLSEDDWCKEQIMKSIEELQSD